MILDASIHDLDGSVQDLDGFIHDQYGSILSLDGSIDVLDVFIRGVDGPFKGWMDPYPWMEQVHRTLCCACESVGSFVCDTYTCTIIPFFLYML